MRITESQIIAACEIARQVFAGQIKSADGVSVLVNEHGLNKATAHDFIYDYKCLLQGKVFHRAMSAPAMRYFMSQIFSRHGAREPYQAVISLRAHIEYYEGHYKTTMHALRAVADEFETLSQKNKTISEVEQAFEAAVKISLLESQSNRLQRLAKANKMPNIITVHSTVFVRNPDVVAEALLRAAGTCERCKNVAPFCRIKDGTPYLEVHHKIQLAKGGEDSLENTVVLCPNCHRWAHYGAPSA